MKSTRRGVIDWDAQPLGDIDDSELGARLGVTGGAVAWQRYKRGIPSWTSRRYDHIDWDAQPLGESPDSHVAKDLGVDWTVVKRERERRKITAFNRDTHKDVDWDAQPFGIETDSEIGRRLGVHSHRVGLERKKRGIAPKSSPGRDISNVMTPDGYAICGNCECLFLPSDRQLKRLRAGAHRACCSPACRIAQMKKPRKERPWLGPCPTCGKMFQSLRTEKIYCGLRCYVGSSQFAKHIAIIREKSHCNRPTRVRQVRERQHAEAIADAADAAATGVEPEAIAKQREHRLVQYTCLECGKQWFDKPCRPRKFCSHAHYRLYMAKRFDRWIANPQTIALPQAYDEFLTQEELPCLVDGCTWRGKHLGYHVNAAHGITAEEFKRAAGFNLKTGLVSFDLHQQLCERPHIHEASFPDQGNGSVGARPAIKHYVSLEAREHGAKSRALMVATAQPMRRICRVCGTTFTQSTPFGHTKYCSTRCRSKFYATDNGSPTTLSCWICGDLFAASKDQRQRHQSGKPVFCGVQCRQMNNGAVGAHTKRLKRIRRAAAHRFRDDAPRELEDP